MSETLLGVIIGGLIGSIASLINLCFEWKKWRENKQIELYKARREKIENMLKIVIKNIDTAINTGDWTVDLYADMYAYLPNSINREILNLIREEDRTTENLRKHYIGVRLAMNEYLKEIDGKIDRLVGIR